MNINKLYIRHLQQQILSKDYSDRLLYLYTKETIEFGSVTMPAKLRNIELIIKNHTLFLTCDSQDFDGKVVLKAKSIFSQRNLMNLKVPLLVKYKGFKDYNGFLLGEKTKTRTFGKGLLTDKVYQERGEVRDM